MSTVDTALPQPEVARDQARALFGQTMGLVAVTAGLCCSTVTSYG